MRAAQRLRYAARPRLHQPLTSSKSASTTSSLGGASLPDDAEGPPSAEPPSCDCAAFAYIASASLCDDLLRSLLARRSDSASAFGSSTAFFASAIADSSVARVAASTLE